MDLLSLILAAVTVLSAVVVVALRREAAAYAARRTAPSVVLSPEQIERLTAGFAAMQTAMRDLAPAAARAGASMRAFGDAFHGIHRTAARPAHRARRADR